MCTSRKFGKHKKAQRRKLDFSVVIPLLRDIYTVLLPDSFFST